MGVADEETLFVVVRVDEPAGDALGTVAAHLVAMGAAHDAKMREPDDGERNLMLVISEMVLVGPRAAESGLGGEAA
jgi:hypothetical protein